MHNKTVMLTIKCINPCWLPRATVAPSRHLCALLPCRRVAGDAPRTCQRRTGTFKFITPRSFATASARSNSSCRPAPSMLARWRSPSQLELPKGTGSHRTAPNAVLQFGKYTRARGSVVCLSLLSTQGCKTVRPGTRRSALRLASASVPYPTTTKPNGPILAPPLPCPKNGILHAPLQRRRTNGQRNG